MRIAITFVPGAAGLGGFWAPIAERLPASWQSGLIDLPGLGPVPADPAVASYDDLVEYVADRITAPTVLVGQSMGAFIALQLAVRHPHLVSHLVLCVLTGGVNMSNHGALEWRHDYPSSYPSAQPWARAAVPDLTKQLAAVRIPTLLLWATRDALSPLGVAEELASKIHGARLVTIESDDHWVARTFAEDTAAAIVAFVNAPAVRKGSGEH